MSTPMPTSSQTSLLATGKGKSLGNRNLPVHYAPLPISSQIWEQTQSSQHLGYRTIMRADYERPQDLGIEFEDFGSVVKEQYLCFFGVLV